MGLLIRISGANFTAPGLPSLPDVDAAAIRSAIIAAGDTLSAPQYTALSNFITGSKADGDWSKYAGFYPVGGSLLAGARVGYKQVGGVFSVDTLAPTGPITYTANAGFSKAAGDGSFLTTGVNPATFVGGGGSAILTFVSTADTSNGLGYFGVSSNSSSSGNLFALFGGAGSYAAGFYSGLYAYSFSGGLTARGGTIRNKTLIIGSRVSTNTIYQDGVQVGVDGGGAPAGAVPNAALQFFPLIDFRGNPAVIGGAAAFNTGLDGAAVTRITARWTALMAAYART